MMADRSKLFIEQASAEGVTRVAVAGEIDMSNEDELRRRLAEAAAIGLRLELDLAGVEFMDSSGLRALIEVRRDVAVGSMLVLTGVSPAVARLLEVTHMSAHFGLPVDVE